jgi:hypothetical protein
LTAFCFCILTTLLPSSLFALANPNPITITNLTQTGADASWPAVSGATGYVLYDQCSDGTYGFQWCQFATATGTSYSFTGLQPGTAKTLCVSSVGNGCPSLQGGPSTTFFVTYEAPWIQPIVPTNYTINCGWVAVPTDGGVPTPSVSLINAPSAMWLGWAFGGVQNGDIYWNAQSTSGATFTLELTNSQGTASQTTTLTPNANPACNPAVVPPRVIASVIPKTTVQWVLQGIPTVHRLAVYVLRRGSTCWCADTTSPPTLVKPGVYRKTFTNMKTSGTYQVQAFFGDWTPSAFSNPVRIIVP